MQRILTGRGCALCTCHRCSEVMLIVGDVPIISLCVEPVYGSSFRFDLSDGEFHLGCPCSTSMASG